MKEAAGIYTYTCVSCICTGFVYIDIVAATDVLRTTRRIESNLTLHAEMATLYFDDEIKGRNFTK